MADADPVVVVGTEQALAHIIGRLILIERTLTTMVTQADIDALATQLQDALAPIRTEIQQLTEANQRILDAIAANQALSLSDLQAVADQIASASAGLTAVADVTEGIVPPAAPAP